jgi:tetratricopeptide (TPR) repeat protein
LLLVAASWRSAALAAEPRPTVDPHTADERFLAGLSERRLYDLAEAFCRRKLAKADANDERRARLTIELARAIAARALDSPRDERERLWKEAFGVLADYRARYPDGGFASLVEYHRAVLQLEQAEILRQEAELAGGDGRATSSARRRVRAAIKSLRELDESLADLARSPNGARDPATGLTKPQIASLASHTRYQLGRAFRNQAETYAAGSADRANALGQAKEMLQDLIELEANQPVVWNSRLEWIRAARLGGDLAEARKMADRLLEEGDPRIQQAAHAERLRLLAAASATIGEALRIVAADRGMGRVETGDLALAQLEVQIAAWRFAKQAGDAQAERHLADATATLAAIRAEFPGFAAMRAVRLLDATDESAILVRSAENYYHEGRFEEAIAAYDRAAKAAGDAARQFDLSLIAAKIEHQRGRHAAAVRRYRQLALASPSREAAADAHLVAIQLVAADPILDEKLYAELLGEHVAKWGGRRSAGEAFVRLGQLAEVRREWPEAIGAYMQVPRGSASELEAIRGVQRCTAPLIAAAQGKQQRTDQLAGDAAKYFEGVVQTPDGKWPERFDRVAQEACLAAARIRLEHVRGSERFVEQMLSAATENAVEPTRGWRAEAAMLSVVALAMQGKATEARQRIADVASPSTEKTTHSTDHLLELLAGIRRAAAAASDAQAEAMAQLQLDVVGLLEPHAARLKSEQQRTLFRTKAEALAASGRRNKALALYEKLAPASPQDGDLQEAYAELLLAEAEADGARRPQVDKALAAWRAIEAHSRPRSARWLRAKYAVASLHLKLGDAEQARKIVSLTRVLSPDLGGEEMKEKFEELLK